MCRYMDLKSSLLQTRNRRSLYLPPDRSTASIGKLRPQSSDTSFGTENVRPPSVDVMTHERCLASHESPSSPGRMKSSYGTTRVPSERTTGVLVLMSRLLTNTCVVFVKVFPKSADLA